MSHWTHSRSWGERLAVVLGFVLVVTAVPAITGSEPASAAEVTPDGSLVYVNGGIRIAPPSCVRGDSTCEIQLTTNTTDAHPVWSPTGQEIAFTRTADDNTARAIFVIHVANGTVRQVTFTDTYGDFVSEPWDSEPTWSPDGRRIAFVRQGGNFDVGCADRIHIVGRAGGPSSVIPGDRGGFVEGSWDGEPVIVRREPSWSPDGNKIAYTRELGIVSGCVIATGSVPLDSFFQVSSTGDGDVGVYISSIATHNDEVPVTFGDIDRSLCAPEATGLVRYCPGELVSHPDWSPDGARLVVRTDTNTEHSSNSGVWSTPAPGTAGTSTLITRFAAQPVWAPDGDFIAVNGISKYSVDGGSELLPRPPEGSQPDVQCLPASCVWGGVTIVKTIDGGGAADVPASVTFDYSGDVTGSLSFEDTSDGGFYTRSLLGVATQAVNTVVESESESDWDLVSISCDDDSVGDVATRTVTVTLERGEFVTCTFASIWDSVDYGGDDGDTGDHDESFVDLAVSVQSHQITTLRPFVDGTVTVENVGTAPAIDPIIQIRVGSKLDLQNTFLPIGCSVGPAFGATITCVSTDPVLTPGEEWIINFRGEVSGAGLVEIPVVAFSTNVEQNLANNLATLTERVRAYLYCNRGDCAWMLDADTAGKLAIEVARFDVVRVVDGKIVTSSMCGLGKQLAGLKFFQSFLCNVSVAVVTQTVHTMTVNTMFDAFDSSGCLEIPASNSGVIGSFGTLWPRLDNVSNRHPGCFGG